MQCCSRVALLTMPCIAAVQNLFVPYCCRMHLTAPFYCLGSFSRLVGVLNGIRSKPCTPPVPGQNCRRASRICRPHLGGIVDNGSYLLHRMPKRCIDVQRQRHRSGPEIGGLRKRQRATLPRWAQQSAERKILALAQVLTDYYSNESAQIFCAQFIAYSPSSSFAPLDTPPDPGTVSMVFFAAS
ncbi:MAG: hypothetical protein RL748_321 [Pseudomonadota bacterium]